MGKKRNRWVILAAAAVSGLMAGIFYVWSVFKNPLMEAHGWSSNEVTLAYSLFALLMLLGAFASGPLQRRVKPSVLVLVAGLMQGLGFIITGLVSSVPMLYLSFSGLAGIGNGIIYGAAVSAATRWFPDKKGLANGICLGFTGLAPLLFAPLGDVLIRSFDVSTAFIMIGGITVAVFLIAPWFISAPDDDWTPEGWEPTQNGEVAQQEFTFVQMLKTPTFWTYWIVLVCAICSGAMMSGHVSAMSQHMVGLSAAEGSLIVALWAIASCLGRFILGTLSDVIGRAGALVLALVVTAVDMLCFMGAADSFLTFVVAMLVVGFCYGGIMSCIPSIVGDEFGQKHFSVNYPFMFSAYTVASFIGPLVASNIVQTTGEYSSAFLIAGALAIVSFVVLTLSRLASSRRRTLAAA